ncbi:cupin domain-containing protein [Microvirga zambiensis]|uniref:cupin domain-containing protein n=1 Tax=Microvirga zambiensis TaxID=1402137 RepID=UPI00191ED08D|nr:cupin domain-containing protein [Microvirga zambiensis]
MAQISGFLGVDEGRTVRLGTIDLTFLNPGSTHGDYSVCMAHSPPGSGAGLHRHPYDEWHVIIEGRWECQVGNEVRILGPGGAMFAPGGTVHGLKSLGPDPGRQIGITSPAGVFEALITEIVDAQVDTGGPARAGSSSFREIAAKYGVEFV